MTRRAETHTSRSTINQTGSQQPPAEKNKLQKTRDELRKLFKRPS